MVKRLIISKGLSESSLTIDVPQYWDMGIGMGNFSYAALNASMASRSGSPIKRDTSIAYPGPGEAYNGSMIGDDAPGGWRLLRINVTDPFV